LVLKRVNRRGRDQGEESARQVVAEGENLVLTSRKKRGRIPR